MLEGAFCRKLKRALEAALPDAVVLRHVDAFTGGIPDLSVSRGARTLWIEIKRHKEKTTKLQTHTLKRFKSGAITLWFSREGNEVFYQQGMVLTDWMSIASFTVNIRLWL